MTSDSVQLPSSAGQRFMLLMVQHDNNVPERLFLKNAVVPVRNQGFWLRRTSIMDGSSLDIRNLR